jgi:DNA-binding NarL/FixJ family response regulator
MKPHPVKSGENGADSALKVMIADTQSIYRVGIRKIFGLEDDIRVVAQAENLGQAISAATKYSAHIIIFETGITSSPAEAVSELLKRSPESKIIALVDEANEDDTVDLLRRGVRGIVPRSIAPELLVKCVRRVAAGELWLDNKGVNWIIQAYRAQALHSMPRQKARISDKEMLIISCVSQGMRNKEIALEIGTTEQVIKNYLRKIYAKLGVADRLELALYSVHHKMMQPTARPAPQLVPQPVPPSASGRAPSTAAVIEAAPLAAAAK